MPNNVKATIMASRGSVISLTLFGVMFVISSLYKIWHAGEWGYSAGLTAVVFILVWSFFIYRLVRYPLIVFQDDSVEIVAYPLSRSKKVAFKDIKDIYKSWDREAKILLISDKKINIPISFMKNADYEYVFSEIKKGLKSHSNSK